MCKASSSMSMIASVDVFLSASLGSPHHCQKMRYSSCSPWHVGHRGRDRTADTLTRAAFRPVFRCTDGSAGVGREIVPCHGIGQRTKETPKQFELLVFQVCFLPCLFISKIYFHCPDSPVSKRESLSASLVVHPERMMALPRFRNRLRPYCRLL